MTNDTKIDDAAQPHHQGAGELDYKAMYEALMTEYHKVVTATPPAGSGQDANSWIMKEISLDELRRQFPSKVDEDDAP